MITLGDYRKIRKYKREGESKRSCARLTGLARGTVDRYWDGGHTPFDKINYPAKVESSGKLVVVEKIAAFLEENKGNESKKQ
ncbi:MAG: hypothetical protein LBQ68_08275, partial [Clostridiales bacterium]|nr:hypothetical protein [Clostridiales bacterium]